MAGLDQIMTACGSMSSIVTSSHSRRFTKDGIAVELWIYRLVADTEWQLEVVAPNGDSLIWEAHFCTADEANEEFTLHVEKFGMASFLVEQNVAPLWQHGLQKNRGY